MEIWRSAVVVAATLAVGCTGQVGASPGAGGGTPGSGAGTSVGTGGGGPGASTGGTTSGGAAAPNGTSSSGGSGAASSSGGTSGGSGGSLSADCTPAVPATSQIPRLTNAEYDRTVRDLLGVTNLAAANGVAPSTRLATDQAGGLTDLAWANYKDVADMIATQVMSDPKLKGNFLKCTPTGGDTTCLHDTIIEFGRRAFRRPLTDEEVARFDAVVAQGAEITPTGAPEEVAQTLLYMFLISPSFLQRAEISEVPDGANHFTLSSYEIASRLSYMLWGSMPDAELARVADQNELSTPQQIAAQAQRMLQDERAHEMVRAFHEYYLLMGAEGRWGTANRDPSLFPNFDPNVVSALTDETLKFFDTVAFTDGATFKDFLTSPIAFVNKDTAPLYGLDPSQFGTELTQTTLDPNQRPGFLTRLGFLMNFASYTRTNPIYRGAFITKQVLGIPIDPPPPGAAQTPLPTSEDLDTNRKQVDAQTSGSTCAGCHHTFINPPGFVMEAFDAMGAWRTAESSGVPLDTTADVVVDPNQDPVHVTSPAELMKAIASSPGAMRQYVTKWVSYAYQREGDPEDACTVNQLAAKMTAGNYAILNLIVDLTQTPSFRLRSVEVTQ